MTTDAKLVTKVVTPEFRVSYPNVFTPKAAVQGQEPKYSVSLLFPKKSDGKGGFLSVQDSVPAEIKTAAVNAIINKFGADKAKWPKGFKLPWRDGAEDGKVTTDGYGPSVLFINASSKNRPGVVDQDRKTIVDPNKFYGGCYAYAELNAFWYDTAGNKGVAFGLNHLLLSRDGEPFSSRGTPENAFKSIPTPSPMAAKSSEPADEDPFA